MAHSVHGRKVLMMVVESERSWPREALVQTMTEEFGSVFHTCSVEGLGADDLIALFINKGKMVASAEGITVDRSRLCGGHH